MDAAEKAGNWNTADYLWSRLVSYTGIDDRDVAAWRRRLADEGELFRTIIHHELSRQGRGFHPGLHRYLEADPLERMRAVVRLIDEGKLTPGGVSMKPLLE